MEYVYVCFVYLCVDFRVCRIASAKFNATFLSHWILIILQVHPDNNDEQKNRRYFDGCAKSVISRISFFNSNLNRFAGKSKSLCIATNEKKWIKCKKKSHIASRVFHLIFIILANGATICMVLYVYLLMHSAAISIIILLTVFICRRSYKKRVYELQPVSHALFSHTFHVIGWFFTRKKWLSSSEIFFAAIKSYYQGFILMMARVSTFDRFPTENFLTFMRWLYYLHIFTEYL